MKPAPLLSLLAFAAAAHVASAADLFPFVLPWDDASESATNISWLNDRPAGRDGFVRVQDGHLFAGQKRLRIFGVNTCFAANFPDKDMAPKVAARMAKFGINCVRFHHMDMMNAPGGIFAQDGRTLDPGQLDRLDFFIAELKKNGIYADLNLHVSRTYPDRPRAEKKGNPDFDKGVDNFCAAMIALQKDYARDLLTHVNAYTGNRYADEPAVALVEINNENAFGRQWFGGEMDHLPGPYLAELETLWGRWILKKHGSDDTARATWGLGARDGGRDMLRSAGNPAREGTGPRAGLPALQWNFEQHGGAVAKGVEKDGAITVNVEKPGTEPWHVQFSAAPVAVKVETYEVLFSVRATRDTTLTVALQQAHEPWKILGSANVKTKEPSSGLTTGDPDWRTVLIQTTEADSSARLTIGGMGTTTGTFEFSGFWLRIADIHGSLHRDINSGGQRVTMLRKRDLARTTQAKQRDWQEFIWDTETAYWNGLRDFLKKELGVKAPIVGTQGFWSPGHVQAGMDVIDSHAYWHHPDFHGKGWNADVWSVKNEPMAGAPGGGTLPGLAAQRVAGKPFLCTEYNHPAPNTYSAETFPLLCAFAALQDWDGVFAFSYSHRAADGWAQESFNNFFDIDRHTVKMATLPGAVLSFRRGDIRPTVPEEVYGAEPAAARQRVLIGGPSMANPGVKEAGSAWITACRIAYEVAEGGDKIPSKIRLSFAPVIWDSTEREVFFSNSKHGLRDLGAPKGSTFLDGPDRSVFAVGRTAVGGRKEVGNILLDALGTRQNWACYQLTVLDRDERADFSTARRILITATGDIENTGMGWKNAEKTGVGRDWGKAPVLVEGPAAKFDLASAGKFKAWALDERGQRRAEIPVTEGILEIGPQHRTLWYEVERQP